MPTYYFVQNILSRTYLDLLTFNFDVKMTYLFLVNESQLSYLEYYISIYQK